MELAFLGGAQTVTGSMHLITVNSTRILLDCGLYQGHRAESWKRNRNLPFDPSQIDVLVLSHAHIDHSGNIPSLVRSGFKGHILSTPGTRDLCAIMLRDSAHIHESDAAYVNKKHRRRGEPLVEPLYTDADARRSLEYFLSLNYHRPLPIAPGVRLTYYDAGHILGSAMVLLEIEERGTTRRLLFSGDLGRPGAPLIRDPEVPPDVDLLITESTYGDREHGDSKKQVARLRDIINQVYDRGGKVIIPAFSVGRTQDIIYSLHELLADNEIPALPVYVDSPLSVNATEVFRLHPECYDQETFDLISETNSRSPFSLLNVHYIRDVADSMKLNSLEEPAVIISSSGMAETGRILHHLKHHIEDERCAVVLVGWQAPNTLGRRLAEQQDEVRIFGDVYHRRAEVHTLFGFSAHADRSELLAWFDRVRGDHLEQVFVVHGEGPSSSSLAEAFSARGVPHVVVPELGERIEV